MSSASWASASTFGSLPLTLPRLPDLPACTQALLAQVPAGRVTTFGAIARTLGDVRAARWVAHWLQTQRGDGRCAWQRVVRSTGQLAARSAVDQTLQREQLESEGVAVECGSVCLSHAEVPLQSSESPLLPWLAFQSAVAAAVSTRSAPGSLRLLCGLDVAYPRPGLGVAAAVLLEAATLQLVAERRCERRVEFPYIPGYLTYRELPLLLDVWAAIRPEIGAASVTCLVDGNGRLHPRRAGVASGFGVVADVPTIGVSKSLLCGRLGPDRSHDHRGTTVEYQGEVIGMAIPGGRGSRPLYISVGHLISLPEAVTVVQHSLRQHWLPEPTHAADRLSRSADTASPPALRARLDSSRSSIEVVGGTTGRDI